MATRSCVFSPFCFESRLIFSRKGALNACLTYTKPSFRYSHLDLGFSVSFMKSGLLYEKKGVELIYLFFL